MIKNKRIQPKLLSIENPEECNIIERINRFVVKIRLNGTYYRAWINNTGRLGEFLVKGRTGFCVRHKKLGKTDFRLFSIKDGAYGAVIDTQLQMKAFEKTLELNLIPWLNGCSIVKRNAQLGRSLIDYLLGCDRKDIYLEVKSAVLRDESYAMYPDCPSVRGRKHIKDLIDFTKNDGRGIIVFIAALPHVEVFRPNKSADQELYRLLQKAYKCGVDIKSIGLYYNPLDSFISLFDPDLKIDLS